MAAAANLVVVRRSTAGLLRLVRSQAATFATERPPPLEPFGTVVTSDTSETYTTAWKRLREYFKKYNLLKDSRSFDEILDEDKEWESVVSSPCRRMANNILLKQWQRLICYGEAIISILFAEHLLKHCSHRKVQLDEALKFKQAFSLTSIDTLAAQAEVYYIATENFRDKRKLPKGYKDYFIKDPAESMEKARNYYRSDITDEVMTEIEEVILKVNPLIAAEGNPWMGRPR